MTSNEVVLKFILFFFVNFILSHGAKTGIDSIHNICLSILFKEGVTSLNFFNE